MRKVATEGSQHICPICKAPGIIVKGESNVLINGKPVATIKSTCNCGAQIETGTANILVNGKAIASVGDLTSHGSTIISGSPNVFTGGSLPTAVTPIEKIPFPKISFANRITNTKGVKEFEKNKKLIKELAQKQKQEKEDNKKVKITNGFWTDEKYEKITSETFFGQEVKIKLETDDKNFNGTKQVTIISSKDTDKNTLLDNGKPLTLDVKFKNGIGKSTESFPIDLKWYNENNEEYDGTNHITIVKPKNNIVFTFETTSEGKTVEFPQKDNDKLKPITYRRNYEELLGLLKIGEKGINGKKEIENNYENEFIKKYSSYGFLEIEKTVVNFINWLRNNPNAQINDNRA